MPKIRQGAIPQLLKKTCLLISLIYAFILFSPARAWKVEGAPVAQLTPLVPSAVARTPSVRVFASGEDLLAGIPLLKRACSCESWGDPNKEPREFKDGVLLRGYPNPHDVGACQINEPLWGATATKLGLSIETSKIDNEKMALYIYSKQGMNAWVWSKNCWNL